MAALDPSRLDALAVRGHRRSRDWRSVTHGVHGRAALPDEWRVDLAAWQLLMPSDGCFTGLTAARVRGWWLPPLPEGTPVFMAMHRNDPRPMRSGVRTSRHPTRVPYDVIDGLRVATAAETLLACARVLSLLDLVPMVDHALRVGDVTWADLEALLARRRPGAAALRRAMAVADPAAESGWESLLRMLHVSCDAPVECQYVVRDSEGEQIARADLRVTGTRSLHEYDGAYHRDGAQYSEDRRRDRRLEAADYVRRGYVADDLLTRPVSILRDIDRALGRPHDPRRIEPWRMLLQASLHTWKGQVAFARRVGVTRPRRRAA